MTTSKQTVKLIEKYIPLAMCANQHQNEFDTDPDSNPKTPFPKGFYTTQNKLLESLLKDYEKANTNVILECESDL